MAYDILDCTLRDGGYYTNWDFDEELIKTYFREISKLPILAVEVGYCNFPREGYRGEWCYLGKDRLASLKTQLRPDQALGIMLDAKDHQPERLKELLGDLVGIVDLVRMAVAPKQFAHGVTLARELKRLGFKVGFNTMYLSTYSNDLSELWPLKDGIDAIDMLALVDSYGGCSPTQVTDQITKVRAMFPGMKIGFHGHDNTCMAYANALAAADAGAQMLDSTFVGMGRGAGNTRTEMLIVHKANQEDAPDINFDAVAHIVDRFEKLRDIYKWGTNLPYMLSGSANLPQKEVMDWLGKNRYSPVSVVRALKNQSDASIDTRAYTDLRSNNLPPDARDTVLIVGGGSSVTRHLNALRTFVRNSGASVIHANTHHLDLIGALGSCEFVCLPGHAALHIPHDADLESVAGFVVPQPPRFPGTIPAGIDHPVFQTASYPTNDGEQIGPISDIGPLSLALGAARALSVRRIYLVGFDGYENATIAEQELAAEIQTTLTRVLAEDQVSLYSLTPTLYDLPTRSIYAEAQTRSARIDAASRGEY